VVKAAHHFFITICAASGSGGMEVKMKLKIDTFNVLIFISSTLSFVVSIMYSANYAEGYHAMMFFPIFFLIFYFLFLQSLRCSNFPFTVYGIIGMQWIRFVLMPPVCAIAGENVGFWYINPTTNSLNLAIILVIYEFLIVSIFSKVLFSSTNINKFIKQRHERLILDGNKLIYLAFILVAISILFIEGRNDRLIYFLYIPIASSRRVGDLIDTYLVLARQIVIVGLFLSFLWIVSYCKLRYEKNRKKIYVYLAIIVALINVAVIVGERRTAQIYTAIVCMWILSKTFPLHKKRVFFSIGITAFFVLLLMSVYKFFAAFQYSSYVTALTNSNIDIAWFSRTLQSYFFGPENVAAVIDFSKTYNIRIENMFFDFLRSIFGISFLMKGQGVLTSERFNTYIYGVDTPTGHVISSISYGYIYFGVLLSPIITVLNIIISSKIEKKMYTSKSYEMTYVWVYILARFATNLFVNTPPLISYATIMLGTGGLLFITAKILKSNKNSVTINNIGDIDFIKNRG